MIHIHSAKLTLSCAVFLSFFGASQWIDDVGKQNIAKQVQLFQTRPGNGFGLVAPGTGNFTTVFGVTRRTVVKLQQATFVLAFTLVQLTQQTRPSVLKLNQQLKSTITLIVSA